MTTKVEEGRNSSDPARHAFPFAQLTTTEV